MVFNSFIFILVFLPILLIGWFGLNKFRQPALAQIFLILMSLWFYGSYQKWYLAILMISALGNYGLSRLVHRRQMASWSLSSGKQSEGEQNPASQQTSQSGTEQNFVSQITLQASNSSKTSKVTAEKKSNRDLLICGVLFNLILLGFFKYVTPALGENQSALKLAMPIGLSFYTFSQISFIVDRCRGEQDQVSFLNYLTYVTYFPKLAEGPITFYEEIMSQFADPERRRFNQERFARGFALFILGMGKKVLIADTLAPVASYGFREVYYLDTLSAILCMMAYAFQLYFDFSGFIDMATGISQILGIDLPVNFDSPYKALNFGQFWQKWHMTLTRFLTKYVYIPLGGSRKGRARTQINVLTIFVISAIWHGTGLTYLAWGILSGLLVVLYNLTLRKFAYRGQALQAKSLAATAAASLDLTLKKQRQICVPDASQGQALQAKIAIKGQTAETNTVTGRTLALRLVVFITFVFTLVFFGAPDISVSWQMLQKFFIFRMPGWIYAVAGNLNISEFYPLEKASSILAPNLTQIIKLCELIFMLVISTILVNGRRNAAQLAATLRLTRRNGILLGILLIWCMLSMTGVQTYLYFAF